MNLEDFVRESNRIEGILRAPFSREIEAHKTLLKTPKLNVYDLEGFVSEVQPGAVLRRSYGLNVQVGDHIAPYGGPQIEQALEILLTHKDPYQVHLEYEDLHPFTDGNGRSGRALWLWMMGGAPLGFLHKFYYQTLEGRS